MIWFGIPLTIRPDQLQVQDVTNCFNLMFHLLAQNPKEMVELICDFVDVLDQIWYARIQVRFHDQQLDPYQVMMKINRISKERRKLGEFKSTILLHCRDN